MTDETHTDPRPDQAGAPRHASVQWRGDGAPPGASLMDPANQSLADALRITYRLILLAMGVLVVLYVGSGFQSVRSNERGVMLVFGRVVARDLKPGFHLAPPYPFGELIKVDVGNRPLNIDEQFWPFVKAGDEEKGIDGLVAKAALSVEQDGSLLTGDGAIAHSQWAVQYAREDASAFAEHVYPGHEQAIVQSSVQRGIVQAVAGVSIDDLLKQSSQDADSVAIRARSLARQTLEQSGLELGIEIDQISLRQKIPPAYLREAFSSVLAATSNASKAREEAQKEGNTLLANTAGAAAPHLIRLIDEYERQVDAGEAGQAERTLAKIDRVFDGGAVELGGTEVPAMLGGEVSTMLSRADASRTRVVDQARSDLADYEAQLAQFQTNPMVMVDAAWTDAISSFFRDERVEVFFQPTGTDTLELLINSDPAIANARAKRILEAANQRTIDERLRRMEQSRFETQEGLRAVPN